MSSASSGSGAAAGGPSITELELRFAQQPDSDAFIPLCEAYLANGRTMEAMVVCKKGIKARPQQLDGQLLLVRILTAQQKLSRARKEIDRIVAEHETRAEPFLARARLALQMGEVDAAVADLLATLERNPQHDEARALLAQHAPERAPARGAPESAPGGPAVPSAGPSPAPPAPPARRGGRRDRRPRRPRRPVAGAACG